MYYFSSVDIQHQLQNHEGSILKIIKLNTFIFLLVKFFIYLATEISNTVLSLFTNLLLNYTEVQKGK
jgi:hypothetical protein